jgi:hypothetical protein
LVVDVERPKRIETVAGSGCDDNSVGVIKRCRERRELKNVPFNYLEARIWFGEKLVLQVTGVSERLIR